MIRISIIIPIYNVETYINRCIKSIIEQEGCGAQIECILVDDCSPDKSIFIVHSVLKKYHGRIDFKIIKHKRNRGLSAARNTGLKAAHGDYILFVDSDDWLPAKAISYYIEAMKKYPNTDMISGNYLCKANGNSELRKSSEIIQLNNYQLRRSLLWSHRITCFAWNKLVKYDIIVRNNFHDGIIYEDKLWTYFLLNDIQQAVIIPNCTYVYENDHIYSIVNTAETKQNASLYIMSICILGNKILDSPYKDMYSNSIFFFLSNLIISLDLRKKFNIMGDASQYIGQLRKRVILQSFIKGRWFLSLFILLLTYPPTAYIFYIRWIRKHYNLIEKTGKTIANFLENLKS